MSVETKACLAGLAIVALLFLAGLIDYKRICRRDDQERAERMRLQGGR